MKTKLFHYRVPPHATAQDVATSATKAVRDTRCDVLMVDQWTHDMLIRRAWEFDNAFYKSIDLPPLDPPKNIFVAGRPVETLPVCSVNLIPRLRDLKRVAVLTAI